MKNHDDDPGQHNDPGQRSGPGQHNGSGQQVRRHGALWVLDQAEEFICAVLLVGFVSLLFAQIASRLLFGYTIPWGDELATHLFVWFAYFGAVVAAKLSAHNRVSFQFGFFPPVVKKVCEALADLLWVAFNLYFAWLSVDFVFFRMNRFWQSQTLGLPMSYFYAVLPLAFVLMSVRIVINNWRTLVRGEVLLDPEQARVVQASKVTHASKATHASEVTHASKAVYAEHDPLPQPMTHSREEQRSARPGPSRTTGRDDHGK